MRTLVIWIVSVIMFYTTHAQYGEPLTKYSFLEGAAFLLLSSGVLVYNMVVRFPCFMTRAEKEAARIAAQGDDQDETESV
ncbi:MAG: hypothetical protein EZS28_053718 [Streblomastix strix]|uniref:Uncharacterized protein n=1 Tax=Streblomastix strix TaxID=222440 RepID=A0A5J4R710_9EUKA|nr:MAG: hypothetical protein EZS28_053718 [Streblomastix strix]